MNMSRLQAEAVIYKITLPDSSRFPDGKLETLEILAASKTGNLRNKLLSLYK